MVLRLRMAWAVLRGRTVMYRGDVRGGQLGIRPEFGGGFIVECIGGELV